MNKLFLIQKIHFRLLRKKLENLLVHPGQIPILMILSKKEGITQRQIAEKLDLRPATIAIMLRRMEKANLIYRVQDAKDRRVQRVFLSERGRELIDQIRQQLQDSEQKAFENFSQEELTMLNNLLDKMLNNLKNQLGGYNYDKDFCIS